MARFTGRASELQKMAQQMNIDVQNILNLSDCDRLPLVSLDWQLMNSGCLKEGWLFNCACRVLDPVGGVKTLGPGPTCGCGGFCCTFPIFATFSGLTAFPSQYFWQTWYRICTKIHFSADELATHWSTVLSNTRSNSGLSLKGKA